jgi:lipopolysaccharide biosynthesis glycosyltransferase
MYHVVFATNQTCDLKYLAVAVRSLVQTFSTPQRLHIHVLWAELEPSALESLKSSWSDLPSNFSFTDMAPFLGERMLNPQYGYWIYFMLGEALPEGVNRALYLDCDVIVLRDVRPLWDLDMENSIVAGAPDAYSRYGGFARSLSQMASVLGQPFHPDDPYINSGVLMVNVTLWKSAGLAESELTRYGRNLEPFIFRDQDDLNLQLRKKVLLLSPAWNLIEAPPSYDVWKPREYFSPRIRHFAGAYKPDSSLVRTSDKELFYFYLDQTVWKNWRSDADQRVWARHRAELFELDYLVVRGYEQNVLPHWQQSCYRLLARRPYLLPLYALYFLFRQARRIYRGCRRRIASLGPING